MRVLGIDPGVATTGVAVVERSGPSLRAIAIAALRTSPRTPHAERLDQLRRSLLDAIEAHRPDVVAIERFFFNSHVRAAMAVGQASGVALATAAGAGLSVFDYTPAEVKQSVVGVGNATKRQVQAMVAALLGLESHPKPPDAADACALAICHINHSGLERALRSQGAGKRAAG